MSAEKDEYDIDSSDEEDVLNTVGNVPAHFYDGENHIGYEVSGRRIMKPTSNKKGEIDKFLENFDNKDKHRIVKDPNTGQDVILSDGDIQLIRTLCNNRGFIESLGDDFVTDWFTREKMETPISANPPQKASFIPSLSDKKKVSLFVHAIKMGNMPMPKPVDKDEFLDADYDYVLNMEAEDIWSPDYGKYHLSHVPEELLQWLPKHLLPQYSTKYQTKREIIYMPKEPPPGHADSYRPPVEYLLSDAEKKKRTAQFYDKSLNPHRHLDEKPMFPKVYPNLRSVPYSPQLIIDMEKRVRDSLYAARVVKDKVNSSTKEMLASTRPAIETMRPFPNKVNGNAQQVGDVVLSVSVSHDGLYVATGSRQFVKVWTIATMYLLRCYDLSGDITRPVTVAWSPTQNLLVVSSGTAISIMNPLTEEKIDQQMRKWWAESRVTHVEEDGPEAKKSRLTSTWSLSDPSASSRRSKEGCRLSVEVSECLLETGWDASGHYIFSLAGSGASVTAGGALQLHRVNKCSSMAPLSGSKRWLTARFHGARNIPHVYLAEAGGAGNILVYDLAEKKVVKTLQVPGTVSCLQAHHGGSNVVVGTAEGKLHWFDLDMGTTPHKTLNPAGGCIRSIALHTRYPLMACATSNGNVVVFHARVYDSYEMKASIHAVELFKGLDKAEDMRALAFQRSEASLLCGGADMSLRVIDAIH